MRSLTLSELSTLDASAPVPFALRLESTTWHCERILRVLPGRRLVLQARLADDDANGSNDQLLKLFLGSGHKRYRERERRGLQWLAEAGLPVPAVQADLDEQGLSGLLIQYLPGAAVIAAEDQSAVEQAAALLGRMHEAGLWQVDLHLKNFIHSDQVLFAVDGDGVRRRASPVPLGRGLEDLALLAAQRPPHQDEGAEALLATYLANRPDGAGLVQGFDGKVDQARRGRVRRYLKKCFRPCTEFSVTEDNGFRCFARRGRGELVRSLLGERGAFASGDDFLEMEAVKTGNSATLVRTRADGGVVIKRYNIKSFSKALGRLLRPLPRYRRAWMSGQLLSFLDLPTAVPLALIEEKRLLFPPVAYLVMEDLPGRNLDEEIAEEGLSQARAAEVARLFVLLKRAGLTHGDTKAANFIVSNGKVHLIDLDAMHLGIRGFDKDIERFLANWQGDTRERFVAAFQAVDLI